MIVLSKNRFNLYQLFFLLVLFIAGYSIDLVGAEGLGNTALRSKVLANIETSKVAKGVVGNDFNLFSRRATARGFYAEGGWPSAKIGIIIPVLLFLPFRI